MISNLSTHISSWTSTRASYIDLLNDSVNGLAAIKNAINKIPVTNSSYGIVVAGESILKSLTSNESIVLNEYSYYWDMGTTDKSSHNSATGNIYSSIIARTGIYRISVTAAVSAGSKPSVFHVGYASSKAVIRITHADTTTTSYEIVFTKETSAALAKTTKYLDIQLNSGDKCDIYIYMIGKTYAQGGGSGISYAHGKYTTTVSDISIRGEYNSTDVVI